MNPIDQAPDDCPGNSVRQESQPDTLPMRHVALSPEDVTPSSYLCGTPVTVIEHFGEAGARDSPEADCVVCAALERMITSKPSREDQRL
jgi:hypothetical protein